MINQTQRGHLKRLSEQGGSMGLKQGSSVWLQCEAVVSR